MASDEDAVCFNGASGAGVGVDHVADALLGSRPRGAAGMFLPMPQRRRKRQAPAFNIMEPTMLEPEQCWDASISRRPTDCQAAVLCSAHGGTRCQRWKIRGPVRGWSDDGVSLAAVVIVRASSALAAQELYVRAMLSLQPGPYFNNADAYNSVRFVMAAQEAVGVSLGGVSPFSSFSGVTESHMDDEDVEAVLQRAAGFSQQALPRLIPSTRRPFAHSSATGRRARCKITARRGRWCFARGGVPC